ncbi:CHASE2 domain-containing sensor protein [Arthrobacter sp. V4I6]|uniref:hypothetical protein n=1 Tax=unclassified Arthrobacter TaxID=235627 RepID=UPI00278B38B9|nr:MULTISPECIES: hypothetical protein [unclassified Arthrobacter]MDQ0819294.1 CHASE2 domain-containing sensor protein [Arthrobacter sp. V1I7]MDQ0853478.1 CHASE2 domain-containing sensor protein [Arthrobacter sp. V4I6]
MAIERRYLSYATAAIAIAAVPLSFFGPEGLRLAIIGLLMLAGPGTALVLLLRFGPPPSAQNGGTVPLAIAIAIGFSLAMSTLVSTAMIYAGLWSPPVGVCILSLVTLGLLAPELKRSRGSLAGAR